MTEENLTTAPNEEEPVEEVSQEETEDTEESPERETVEGENTETEAEVTAKRMLQGFTQTRQEMADIKRNQEAINEALANLSKKEDFSEDEPLTVKTYLKMQEEQRTRQQKEQERVNAMIDGQVNDLKARGIISTKQDEDELMSFAVKHKITDLYRAAEIWAELQEAKKLGGKAMAQAKNKVKQEIGSQVGTSSKTTVEEQGIDYNEIRNKSLDELAKG